MSEGQKGGEFFTPTSIVKLIVEIIEPYHGRILDPACGSGGMFVQSAAFVEHHRQSVNEISVYGQEKVAETIPSAHGLRWPGSQSRRFKFWPATRRSVCRPAIAIFPQRSQHPRQNVSCSQQSLHDTTCTKTGTRRKWPPAHGRPFYI
jgi:hypothetical protein